MPDVRPLHTMLIPTFLFVLQAATANPAASADAPISITSVRADIDADGEFEIVTLQLVSGRRFLDDEPSCASGEKYEGRFAIAVNRFGQSTVTPLEGDDAPGWLWAAPFSLQLSDYNHDGLVDFNLGTYGACRGWLYLLFTITPDGHVKRLPVDAGLLFNGDRGNATFFPLTAHGFRNSYFDPEKRSTVRQYFRWDPKRGQFFLFRTRVVPLELE